MNQLLSVIGKNYYFFCLAVLLTACTQKKTFENFDNPTWQKDKLGCNGQRQALSAEFEKIRRELLGMTQEDVLELLGRPDLQLLYERSQKFYVYFIEPGVQCQGQNNSSKARTVYFRFNAMNRATEVLYSNGRPF